MRVTILVCAGFAAGFVIRDILIGILIRPTVKKMLGQCEKCIGNRPSQPEKHSIVDKDGKPTRHADAYTRALIRRRAARTVKAYDALSRALGKEPFSFDKLFDEKAAMAIFLAMDGHIDPKTVTETVTILARAGVAQFLGDGKVRLERPTDDLRKDVEFESIRRVFETKEVPA